MRIGGSLEQNWTIKKRQYLVNNIGMILDVLSYYKTWGDKIKDSKSIVLWTKNQKENYCDINEIT